MTATVSCTVPLANLALPGLPGARHAAGTVHQPARCLPVAVSSHAPVTRCRCHRDVTPAAGRAAVSGDDSAVVAAGETERGGLSLMIVVLFVVLVALAGIVVDGGAKLNADENAAALAQEAARAGATTVDESRAYCVRLVRGRPAAGD